VAESLGTATLFLTTKDQGLVAGLKAAKTKSSAIMQGIGRAGKTMTRKLTLPIVAAGAASIHMAADFNDSMSKIVGLVGVSSKQVEGFKKVILKLGPETAKSPKELADAMFFITSAGLRGKKAVEALTISAKASAAGLGETKVVADAMTSAINAYGAGNLTAAQAGDILVATVREGKAEASAIAPVLGNILPIASELGVGFEEVGGSIAQMTRIGMSAANAGTALQSVMSGLLRPTQASADKLKSVGLSAAGLREQLAKKGVISVLQTLNDKFDGNVEAMGQVFPNVRALKGALALAGKAGKSTAGVFDGVKNSTGALNTAFEVAGEDASFKFKQGLVNLQVAGIKAGNILLPMAVSIAAGISKVAQAFSNLSPGAKKFVIVALLIVAALGPMIGLVMNLILVVKGLAIALGFLAANPAVLLLLAVVAIAVGLIYAYKHSEKFRAAVKAVGNALKTALYAVGAFAKGFKDKIVGAFKAVISFLKGNWKTIAIIISGPFAPLVALATDAFGIRSKLIAAFNAVVGAVKGAMGRVVSAIRGIKGAATGAAVAVGKGAWNGIKRGLAAIGGLYGWVWGKVSGALSNLASSMYSGALAIGRGMADGIIAGLGDLGGRLASAAISKLSAAKDKVLGWAGIKSPSRLFAKEIGEPLALGIADGVKKKGKKVAATLTGVVRAAINDAKQNATTLAGSIADTLGSAIDESTRRKLAVYDSGPTGQALKRLQDQLDQEATAAQKADLEAAVAGAETEEEKQDALAALRRWGMEQERDRLAAELEMEKSKVQEAADARKLAVEQGLADLTDALNRGHLTQAEYTQKVQELIAAQAPEYKNLGALLGDSQARGYIDTYNALLAQAGLTQIMGKTTGSGVDLGVVDPRTAAKAELQGILKKLIGRATSKSSPGGKTITKAEATPINAIKARIKALGLADGGLVQGALGRDRAGLFALSNGEGVFRASAMEGMQRYFEKGGSSGAIAINFNGPVIGAGDTRTLGRELARIIQPELNRRVALA